MGALFLGQMSALPMPSKISWLNPVCADHVSLITKHGRTVLYSRTASRAMLSFCSEGPTFVVYIFSEFGLPVAVALNAGATVEDLKAGLADLGLEKGTDTYTRFNRPCMMYATILLALRQVLWSRTTWHEYTQHVFCQVGRRRVLKAGRCQSIHQLTLQI